MIPKTLLKSICLSMIIIILINLFGDFDALSYLGGFTFVIIAELFIYDDKNEKK